MALAIVRDDASAVRLGFACEAARAWTASLRLAQLLTADELRVFERCIETRSALLRWGCPSLGVDRAAGGVRVAK